jgi:hypothetical protein
MLLGQGCLGLPPDANAPEVLLGVQGQNEGFRFGGRVQANIAGVIGLRFGAGAGGIDDFAEQGYEVGGLLARSFGGPTSGFCAFLEYEHTAEEFRDAFGMASGRYLENWIHLGAAVAGTLAESGDIRMEWHAAPALIWRVTHLTGRALYTEPDVHVLVTTKQNTAPHLGGRALLSVRHPRLSVILGVRNRPRISSDLVWGLHVGFPM